MYVCVCVVVERPWGEREAGVGGRVGLNGVGEQVSASPATSCLTSTHPPRAHNFA